uniref:C2H2-type domain-containing protein n=1 Tax=viral metagenome TaxID=1070528 RepID=A0A6C0HM89_9ZZZZ
MSARLCPYKSNTKKLGDFLNLELMIPMNQREYSWTEKEINLYINDIKIIFEENKYIERLGSIIIYKGNNNINEIYDGQQRTITSILLLYAIGLISNNKDFHYDIIKMLSIEKYKKITELHSELHKRLKIKFNDIQTLIIPKIYCVNPNDMDTLVEIFNDKLHHYMEYIANINDVLTYNNDMSNNEHSQDQENGVDYTQNDIELKYICSLCNAELTTEKHFIKHLDIQHLIKIKYSTNSKIYKAYFDIYEKIKNFMYDSNKLIELHNFIINDIELQLYECTESDYVSKIFEWENNRGIEVAKLDLIKNPILIKIPDDKKVEVYEEWEILRKLETNIYSNFGQRLFEIAIQLYNSEENNKEFTRICDYNKCYDPIIKNSDTFKELKKLFSIIKKLNDIYKQIKNHKYGKLITTTKTISLQWEAYMWCLLPIFYKKNTIDDKLIKLLVKWYFRNLEYKNISFNNLAYSNEFLKIINEYLKNNAYDYYTQFYECLKLNANESIKQYYQKHLKDICFTRIKATYLLLFLETCDNTDKHIVNLELTLEHLIPQSKKTDLTDIKNISKLGNLTLLEGSNSSNGHKGNSSLGAKEYSAKKDSYLESSAKITRDIVAQFPIKFEEADIEKRSSTLIKKLDKFTNYFA